MIYITLYFLINIIITLLCLYKSKQHSSISFGEILSGLIGGIPITTIMFICFILYGIVKFIQFIGEVTQHLFGMRFSNPFHKLYREKKQ